jgi:hypothetical protein
VFDKIARLALIPLALGHLAVSGCATGPNQASTSTAPGPSAWTYVGSNSSGDSYFIDHGTIRRSGDYAKVAEKHIWKRPELFCDGNNTAQSGRFVGEYNCRTEKMRTLLSTAYSGPDLDGELVFGSDDSSPWRRVGPGTPGELVLKAVCK